MTIQFGKLPYDYLRNSRAMHYMTGAGFKVFGAIALHVSGGVTWSAYPSKVTIAEITGLALRTVTESIGNLERLGAISTQRGGGCGRPNVYTLTTEKGEQTLPVSKRKRGSRDAVNREQGTQKTGSRRSVNREPQLTPTERNREGTEKNSSSVAATGCASDSEGIDAALKCAGIGQPKRDEIAKAWQGIPSAANAISETADRLQANGKGSGIVVMELEAMAEAERRKLTQRRKQESNQLRDRNAKLADEKEKNAESARKDAEALELVASLSDEVFNEHVQAIKADTSSRMTFHRKMIEHDGPKDDPWDRTNKQLAKEIEYRMRQAAELARTAGGLDGSPQEKT